VLVIAYVTQRLKTSRITTTSFRLAAQLNFTSFKEQDSSPHTASRSAMKHPITLLAALLLLLAVLSAAAPLEQEQEQDLEEASRIVESDGHERVKRSSSSSGGGRSQSAKSAQSVTRLSGNEIAGLYDRQFHVRYA